MSEIRDDPREVLALLNSLGFVGITASQLKAFMKDLKLHRKMKERERQLWKDKTRIKILSKQEQMLNEMLRESLAKNQTSSAETTQSAESDVGNDDSVVRIRVRCVTKGKDRDDVENVPKPNVHDRPTKLETRARIDRPCRAESAKEPSNFVRTTVAERARERSKSKDRSRAVETSANGSRRSDNVSAERNRNSPRNDARRSDSREKSVAKIPARPVSAPELAERTEVPKERSKSVASEPVGLGSGRNPSRCSARSQTKSFIRPWRLQPEAQRAANARKSDPVALYQKYRQEWTQISFPGEDQHASVRWAIREKMLGTDPNPKPILKNAQSLPSAKKR